MSFTYTTDLTIGVNAVRWLVGDAVDAGHMLEDEEIAAVIAAKKSNGLAGLQSSAVYLAAAECLAKLHTKWMSTGKGVASRKVSRLTVVYGTGSGINVDIAVQARIKELRREGARLLAPTPFPLRLL